MQICFPLVSPQSKVWIYLSIVFNRLPPKITYHPREHVNEIKTRIIVYNKFDTKVPIFAIPKDLKMLNYILPRCPKEWEDIQNFQFFINGG
jgi:hypothetical protein